MRQASGISPFGGANKLISLVLTTHLTVRFRDLDSLGHVNNAVYLTYFEQGRFQFFEDVMGELLDWKKHGVILAQTDINFRIPLQLNDKAVVETRLTRIGNKSFQLAYQVWRTNGDKRELAADGTSIQVAFDYATSASIPMPDHWKSTLNPVLALD